MKSKHIVLIVSILGVVASYFLTSYLRSQSKAAYCSCVKSGNQSNDTCSAYTAHPNTPEVCRDQN